MSNCAWMEWWADATSGTATSETANSARMLKCVIFAPEKKELRAESYTRRSTETNRLGRHRISSRQRLRPRCSAQIRARVALEVSRTLACTIGGATEKARFA